METIEPRREIRYGFGELLLPVMRVPTGVEGEGERGIHDHSRIELLEGVGDTVDLQ